MGKLENIYISVYAAIRTAYMVLCYGIEGAKEIIDNELIISKREFDKKWEYFAKMQEENLRKAIGDDLFNWLEKETRKEDKNDR